MNEILTPLTFSEVSRPEAYSRHENEHTQTRCKSHVQSNLPLRCTCQDGSKCFAIKSFELCWRSVVFMFG